MTLLRAIILSRGEEQQLLGPLHALHAVWTPAHSTTEELEAVGRMMQAEKVVAKAHGLDAIKLGISYTRDKGGNWHVNASYPLTPDEERDVRGLG